MVTMVTKNLIMLPSLLPLNNLLNSTLNRMVTKVTKYSITKGKCMLYSINRGIYYNRGYIYRRCYLCYLLPLKIFVKKMETIKYITHHAEYSEKAIEKYLRESVSAVGGLCLKYANPGMTGYPDRLICWPGGTTTWVELKSKGKKPTKIQAIRHEELKRIGHHVQVIDCRQGVDRLIEDWRTRR